MSDLTDYPEQQFRDWISQGVATDTSPTDTGAQLWVSLHTADPGEPAPGSALASEVDSGTTSYARQGVDSSGWSTTSPGSAEGFQNANDVVFPEATESWGTISHVGLSTEDEGVAGEEAIASFALDSNKTIESGDQAKFNAGDLTFEID